MGLTKYTVIACDGAGCDFKYETALMLPLTQLPTIRKVAIHIEPDNTAFPAHELWLCRACEGRLGGALAAAFALTLKKPQAAA